MKPTQLLPTIIAALFAVACARVTEPPSDAPAYERADGLSNQFVYCFAEDTTGQIWIGTFRGLNRYNSREYFRYFEGDDSLSLPSDQVRDLLVAHDGTLYVATVGGLCRRTDRDGFRRVRLPGRQTVFDMAQTADSTIYLNSSGHLLAYRAAADSAETVLDDICPGSTYHISMHVDDNDRLWIVGENSVRLFDRERHALADSIPTGQAATGSFLTDGHRIWLTGTRLRLFDTRRGGFADLPPAMASHPVLGNAAVEFVHPYAGGLLVQTSADGMFFCDSTDNKVTGQYETGFPVDIPDFRIKTVFSDSRDNLWFGGHDQGVAVHYHYTERFNRNKYVSNALAGKSVVSAAVDRDNNLWMATRHDGVYVFDNSARDLRHFPFGMLSAERNIYDETIKNVFVDSAGNIWLALTSGEVLRCSYRGGDLDIDRRYRVWGAMSICEDSRGTIWLGTGTPYVSYLRPGDDGFTPLQVFDPGFCFIPGLIQYDDDHMLAAAFGRAPRLIDVNTLEVSPLPQGTHSLQEALKTRVFIPTDLCRDADGTLWIGTVASGLLRYTPADSSFTAVPGAACADISAIRRDADGHLWVSTLYGLSRFSPQDGGFEHFFGQDGTGGNQFYDRSAATDSAGLVYFGGTHGITSLDPREMSRRVSAPMLFQELMVHNKAVRPGTGIIDRDLSLAPDVHLDYRSNSFGISFVAVDYCRNPRIAYRYMLEGVDNGWVEAGGTHEAYYANLPPGGYVFRAAITGDADSAISLRITVAAPWWRSWWAICVYILIAAAITGTIISALRKLRRQRLAVRKARLEKERERHINDMNMRFFANISHEFRTPLTMISGPIRQLADTPGLSGETRHLLSIANNNVTRMLSLVNQLLDFNRLENDTLPLEVERIDIAELLRRFTDIFANHAVTKHIAFTADGMEDNCFATADADKIIKIYGNLLSNALKFTPRGGSVAVSLDTVRDDDAGGNALKISVRNTGRRIPADKLEKIFERYYRLECSATDASGNCGTGIGLYYARALAKLHHGRLFAVDNPAFEGAEFVLIIPTDDEVYAADVHRDTRSGLQQSFTFSQEADKAADEDNAEDNDKATVLVVDDDIQVAEYLKALLSPTYRVVTRFDADSALQWLESDIPALIVSDVVMPGKDGYELCRTIKNDLRFSHIPVVLLTAKVTAEDQVAGLDAEADAYLTKPFEPSVLTSQIRSLLRNRERARRIINEVTTVDDVDKDIISPRDSHFLDELYSFMEQELGNSEVDVNEVARHMGMSRTKFYYKVKGLTGEPPSVFFKTYKLNRAAELIREHRFTLSEIADMTGFSSLSHFSRSFKRRFGTSPSDYRE